PNQGRTSLCGPASFFYCLQMDRPDVYKQAAIELWMQGKTKIGTLDITPAMDVNIQRAVFILAVVREFQVWTG
ncbi:hypothetical protein M4B56_27935, partial [Klebsiella pneumoniae]|nr:hypothetical protein [Klebsiella pneumoniae]